MQEELSKKTGTLKDYGFQTKGSPKALRSPSASNERVFGPVKTRGIKEYFAPKSKGNWNNLDKEPKLGSNVVVEVRSNKPNDSFENDMFTRYKGTVSSIEKNNERSKFNIIPLGADAEGIQQEDGKGQTVKKSYVNDHF